MSDDRSSALVPLEARTVDFYGEEIVAMLVRIGDELQVYVPLRPICAYLGISWGSQRNRLYRDEVLRDALRSVFIMNTNPQGGDPEVLCLPLELLPGWLFGIAASRVRPELQEKITRYRRECFAALWRAFQTELTQHVPLSSASAPLAQVRNLALAVAQMAEQQMALEQRTTALEQRDTSHTVRLDRAAEVVGELRRRLAKVEDQLTPASFITEDQAAAVSTQVKALAELLTRQGQGKTSYQTVFAAIYTHFGVTSYKLIRREQFDSVLAFLDDWRTAALDTSGRTSDTTGD